MEKYLEDYNALVSEWEQKVINFKKKNRRGHPVTHPIRPEKILSNMYRNYYYKFRKKPGQERETFRNLLVKWKIMGIQLMLPKISLIENLNRT